METSLTLVLVGLFYFIALGLFIRFFAFLRRCDSEMRFMIENGKTEERYETVSQKKKRIRRVKAARFAAA